MKIQVFQLAVFLLALSVLCETTAASDAKGGKGMLENIHWLGHDTFKIAGEKTIFTDPYHIAKKEVADIILITHGHYDHCSPDDVMKIQGPETVIITTADCASKLSGDIRKVKPGDTVTVGKITVEAVPAYNIGKEFHPKANGWVGYVITVNDKRIYLAGDTDRIPEMKSIKADIALLQVSGTYVMTADEAALAAVDIRPDVAIPMHYGSIVGTSADAKTFAEKLKGKIKVVILKKE